MSKMNNSAMPYLQVIQHNTAHHFMKYIFNKTAKYKLVIPMTGQKERYNLILKSDCRTESMPDKIFQLNV